VKELSKELNYIIQIICNILFKENDYYIKIYFNFILSGFYESKEIL